MRFYMTAAVLTDKAVRLYVELPTWDGYEYQGVYQTVGKDTLRFAGVSDEFPAQHSRTVMTVELNARTDGYAVNGDIIVKDKSAR